jgi:osmotically-inducible protein OsmY
MNKGLSLIGGIGLGAALMYILDPDRGNRRRALMRDKMARAANKMGDAIETSARDISHRARGTIAETKNLLVNDEPSDDVLVARVRSKMGRFVSHPHAIKVTAAGGRVMLEGPILEDEVANLLKGVSGVRGVKSVKNKLETHKEAENVSALQGGGHKPGEKIDVLQKNWSPATRVLVGAAGALATVYGASQRGLLGAALSATGVCMLTSGITNKGMTLAEKMTPQRDAVERDASARAASARNR